MVWREAINLAELTYMTTEGFPKQETYGLTSQARRAAVSVASDIAEGYGRDQTGSFILHLRIAQGSLKELETQFIVAERVSLATPNAVLQILKKPGEIGKMLRSLIRSLEEKQASRS